jgi:hypothetical protein
MLVIHCCFQNKNLYQNYFNKVFEFEKKMFFDNLALKLLGLYVIVAYS